MEGGGTFFYLDGLIIEGFFKDNKLMNDQKAKVWYPNGELYEGGWSFGWREGKGKHYYNDGIIYDGEWKNDKRHGFGKIRFPDKSEFQGFYEDDESTKANNQGKSKFIDSEGNVFEAIGHGYFHDGKLFGIGKKQYANGDYFEGEFKNG